jgi:DNA-directed RNA polymerase specialized sigma subunit
MTTDIVHSGDDERESKVLELYNQGKSTREIAELLRISLQDISPIIKKEREKQQKGQLFTMSVMVGVSGNSDARTRPQQLELQSEQQKKDYQQQYQKELPINSATAALELSPKEKAAIAYRLYDEDKTAIQVVTRLYLPENEATRYYREFWRLEREIINYSRFTQKYSIHFQAF